MKDLPLRNVTRLKAFSLFYSALFLPTFANICFGSISPGPSNTIDWRQTKEQIKSVCFRARMSLILETNNLLNNPHSQTNNLVYFDQSFGAFVNKVNLYSIYIRILDNGPKKTEAEKCVIDSDKFLNRFFSKRETYELFNTMDPNLLDEEQKLLLNEYLEAFRQNGVSLEQDDKQSFLQLKSELVDVV